MDNEVFFSVSCHERDILIQCVKIKVVQLFNPLTVTVPPVGRLALFFALSFFPIKYFSNHHKLYIIWKLKTLKFILWKPFWNRILRYHGNGTLNYFGGLLPLSGRCQVSYYTMHYGLLESKLFIILTKYTSPERSDSHDSIFGGLFVIWEILTFVTEKCI